MKTEFVKCPACTETFPYRSNKIYCSRGCKTYSKNKRKHPYNNKKKQHCESCGFVAKHPVQLDIDHIDGNHQNNEDTNLQTLCSNCHRLKTIIAKQGPWRNSKRI